MKKYTYYLWLVFIYILLIFRHGYEYGRSDQIEILPYALKMAGIQDFKGDFFTDTISQVIPNERFVTAGFLSLFGAQQEVFVFLLHIGIALFLIAGLLRIANHILENFYLSVVAVLLTLIVFYYWNLGGNELYGNNLQGSTFAEVLSVWGIVFFIEKKYVYSFLLVTIGIGFQAIAALQVGLLMAGVLVIEKGIEVWKNRANVAWNKELGSILVGLAIFGVLGLGYIFWIKKASDGVAISAADAQAIFDITFRFRNPHHFMPSAFSMKGWLLMPVCVIASLYYFRKHRELMLVFGMAAVGVLLYTYGVEVLENRTVASFQAYKMTIWLKFLGMVAILGIFKGIWKESWIRLDFLNKWESGILIGLMSVLVLIIFCFPKLIPYPIMFDFKDYSERGEEVILCKAITEKTPKDAVFITPFSFTEVPIYAKRAAFISYKANMRHAPHIFEWTARLNTLYGLDYVNRHWDISKASAHYENISKEELEVLKGKGVSYAIFNQEKAYLEEVARTGHYFVYRL